jgi:hypothetical protein
MRTMASAILPLPDRGCLKTVPMRRGPLVPTPTPDRAMDHTPTHRGVALRCSHKIFGVEKTPPLLARFLRVDTPNAFNRAPLRSGRYDPQSRTRRKSCCLTAGRNGSIHYCRTFRSGAHLNSQRAGMNNTEDFFTEACSPLDIVNRIQRSRHVAEENAAHVGSRRSGCIGNQDTICKRPESGAELGW